MQQQNRCIVISGPAVHLGSNAQALLSRCGQRGFVLRSKVLVGKLWVHFRTYQQARRAHKDIVHIGCIVGSQVTCVVVCDSAWPRSGILRGKPGGRRHRGHGRGSGDCRGFAEHGCWQASSVVNSLNSSGARHPVVQLLLQHMVVGHMCPLGFFCGSPGGRHYVGRSRVVSLSR